MPRFEPIMDVAESLCLRSGDILMHNKGLYLDCAKDVWNDLNEDVLHIAERIPVPVRHVFRIDKRTNSITLPCNMLRLSSVNTMDKFGRMYPVYRNDNLNEVVDVGAIKDCACEFNCGNELCNMIKGYEVLNHTENDLNPDGSPVTFNCVDKKVLDGGFLYQQKQYPERVYTNGVWTSTILKTENIKMCAVEVDKNGCICDTASNISTICNACGLNNIDTNHCCIGGTASTPPNPNCDTWIYHCSSIMDMLHVQCGCFPMGSCFGNIYNFDTTGRRLIFPPNFGWDYVVIRMYVDLTLPDIQVPYMAKPTFMTGLMYFSTLHNPKKFQESVVWDQRYTRQKWGLFLDVNKYSLAETRMMLQTPAYVPSYISKEEEIAWWGH